MSENAKKLRESLGQPGIRVMPGIYDCLSARVAEQAGFEVVFTSGYCISAAKLGKPDYGFLTATEALDTASSIVRSIHTPLVADLDTGYGNPLNVIRTVSEAVSVGIAGCILEDQQWPKRCGHMQGKRVIDVNEHAEKIRAAVEAKGESDFVIIARTDARAVNGLDDAIARGRSFKEAGADVIFIEAPQSVEELKEISAAFPDTWLFANMIEGGKTPFLNASELEELGYKLVVFPLSGLYSATAALSAVFRQLKETGSTTGAPVPMVDFSGFEEVIDLQHYRDLESKYTN